MNELYQILPKDLVYIIEDYSKDNRNYTKVLYEFLCILNRFHTCDHCEKHNFSSHITILKYLRKQQRREYHKNKKQIKAFKKYVRKNNSVSGTRSNSQNKITV